MLSESFIVSAPGFPESQQGLDVVIVGIDDAGINLGTSGMVPRGVHEERHVLLAALVGGRTQLAQRLNGEVAIELSLLTTDIL